MKSRFDNIKIPGARHNKEFEVFTATVSISVEQVESLKALGIDATSQIEDVLTNEIISIVQKETFKAYNDLKVEDISLLRYEGKLAMDGELLQIVTSTQVGSAIQKSPNYEPNRDDSKQDTGRVYLTGSFCGHPLWIDPYMSWEDTRLLEIRNSTVEYIPIGEVETFVDEFAMVPKTKVKVLIKKMKPETNLVYNIKID